MSTLTKIYINPRKRGGRKLLTNPQAMHAAVASCFPPDLDDQSGRPLWRTDSTGDTHVLYIVGPEKPDAMHIVKQAGWETRPPATADYSAFQTRLKGDQEWRFALTANPVSSKAGLKGTRGKTVPHVTAEQQLAWLGKKSLSCGFELCEDVAVVARQRLRFRKNAERSGRQVVISQARFAGTLRVTDPEALKVALNRGVGRAKAYGCGLLTLAQPSLM